jgi:hypothetical protein
VLVATAKTFTQGERRAVYARAVADDCWYCGDWFEDGFHEPWQIEHQTPLARGGTHNLANLVPACRRCNMTKHTRTVEEYREWVQQESARRLRAVIRFLAVSRPPATENVAQLSVLSRIAEAIEATPIRFAAEYWAGDPPSEDAVQ